MTKGKSGSPNGSIHRTFRAMFQMPTIQTHKFLTRVCRRQYRNPIHLAMEWQRTITLGEYSSPAALAYHLGISRARVTQIMNLLKLSPEVVGMISSLGDPICGPIVAERRLRSLLVLSAEQQKAQLEFMLSKDKHI